MISCPYCQAPGYECHKNGRNPNGVQRYYCRLCHRNFTPASREEKWERQQQAYRLTVESDTSAREVGRCLGVHHQTVLRWIKQMKRSRSA